jgi:hypothetical protein
MRILDGTRSLDEVELHLTDAEARQVIAVLTDCLDDLSSVGMSESHDGVTAGEREAMLYVYSSAEELEGEVAERMSEGA